MYRLIPIKAIVLFLLSNVRSYFFSLCFVVLALNNNNSADSVSVLYYTIIYSLEFIFKLLSSAEHKRYFKECGKPSSCWSASVLF